MLEMKTTTANGGSHKELSKRAFQTLLNSSNHHIKVDSTIAKFKNVFTEMGYFVSESLSACHWNFLIPKSNPDLFPPIQVYINEDLQSFYVLNVLTGALEFYSFSDCEPDYSDNSIFEKLRFGGVV